jgi:hypothetical protein
MPLDLENVMTIGSLGVEALVDGEMFVLQGENLVALNVRELLCQTQIHQVSFVLPHGVERRETQSKGLGVAGGHTLCLANRQDLALAFAHGEPRNRGDGEVVAGQREDFLLHLQRLLNGLAEDLVRSQGRVEREKRGHVAARKE